ncbi:MAG: helix-turn-helix transcriptional regulator [Elusimicrobia bacterium]|nr:helix-turn-helix transcriptional regulator [Elusimicrobiota bacterium]
MKTKRRFGEILRALRMRRGLGLRTFAKLIEMQPSNLSFIENGRVQPPVDDAILFRIAAALGIKKGSPEWGEFFDAAVAGRSERLPADIAHDRRMQDFLPIMLRTVANQKLDASELKELIERIKSFRPDSK